MNEEETMQTASAPTIEKLTLDLTKEIRVKASLENTFEALLEQIGPENATPEGTKLAMKIEPWLGGKWYRDLGDGNGHYWATVQAIKRPTLLEMWGPLFMSYPVINNVQYRLTEVEGGTLISFRHTALGFIPDDVRQNIATGWGSVMDRVKRTAERRK
jgi:hypothetical protein